LTIVCIMFGVKLALSVLLLNAGYSINGVAFASLVTEYLTYLTMVIISQRLIESPQKEIVREVFTTTGVVAYIITACLIIKRMTTYTGHDMTVSIALKNMTLQEGFIILCLIPIVLSFYRLLGKDTVIRMFSVR